MAPNKPPGKPGHHVAPNKPPGEPGHHVATNKIVPLLTCTQGQKNRFFWPIFWRKICFRWCWKRFSGEKIVCKKISKKSGKIADFSAKNQKNPIFSRKNPIFPEIWGKLYFRSLRGEKLKNGAKQSCRIKKSVFLGKIIHVWCIKLNYIFLSLLFFLSHLSSLPFGSLTPLFSKKYSKKYYLFLKFL